MELWELKDKILNNTLNDSLVILVCDKDYFLANQYIEKLCSMKNCTRRAIDSLEDLISPTATFLTEYSQDLFVLTTDKFKEYFKDYSQFKNCFILCKEIDKKVIDYVSDYTVTVKFPTTDCIRQYISTKCPGLESGGVDWLIYALGDNLYGLTNELDKISTFNAAEQPIILNELRFSQASNFYSKTEQDLTDSLFMRDMGALLDYFGYENRNKDFNPLSLITRLLKKFNYVYLIKSNKSITAVDLGISPKYYYFLSNINYKEDFLIKVVEFLSKLDVEIKSGRLVLDNHRLTDYVISRILSLYVR